MKINIYKIGRIFLLVLIFASIAHAFIQSALPPEISSAESNKVGDIIEEIIPPETPQGQFVQKNLRKLAHFTEFFIIGTFTTIYVLVYMRKKSAFCVHIPFGIFVGLLDETIQIFSGRGPSVTDVWIDSLGYVTATAIVALLLLSAFFIHRWIKRRKSSK